MASVAILVAAGAAFTALPAGAAPAPSDGSFTWTFDCSISNGNADAHFAFVWLDEGTPIPGSEYSNGCIGDTHISWSGTRPANATGFEANLTLIAPFAGSDGDAATKSFELGKAFKVQLSATIHNSGHAGCSFVCNLVHAKASFAFDG